MSDLLDRLDADTLHCVDCGVELTTQEAMAGEVVEDDDGLHHRECIEAEVVTIVEPKVDHLSPGDYGLQERAYRELLLGNGFADGRTFRGHEQMQREDLDAPLDPDRQ